VAGDEGAGSKEIARDAPAPEFAHRTLHRIGIVLTSRWPRLPDFLIASGRKGSASPPKEESMQANDIARVIAVSPCGPRMRAKRKRALRGPRTAAEVAAFIQREFAGAVNVTDARPAA